MTATKPDLLTSINKLRDKLQAAQRYSFIIFLVFIALLYGFVLLRITSLSNAQPAETAINDQYQAAQVPHFDKTVVQQLQSLQDNSVSVKALFDQARNNPFQ